MAQPTEPTCPTSHPKNRPWGYWFQNSQEGEILFIVFFAKACRWDHCTGCNLPRQMSPTPIPLKDQLEQVDWVFSQTDVAEKLGAIQKVIVSNNGSVLDEETFASTTLIYLIANCNKLLPNLRLLTLETRAEYVDTLELDFLARVLKEGATKTFLELAIGVEIFEENARNKTFRKGLTDQQLVDLIEKLAKHGFALKCYFMQKPIPEFSDEAAIADIVQALEWLQSQATKHHLPISMHLNPAFGARGTALGQDFLDKRWAPTSLTNVARAIQLGRAKAPNIPIFVGLSDENLALPGSSFRDLPDYEAMAPKLEAWNATQELGALD
jgi:radical SAM enzyme (TIGR01210 family)